MEVKKGKGLKSKCYLIDFVGNLLHLFDGRASMLHLLLKELLFLGMCHIAYNLFATCVFIGPSYAVSVARRFIQEGVLDSFDQTLRYMI